jgi:hypothetical protein
MHLATEHWIQCFRRHAFLLEAFIITKAEEVRYELLALLLVLIHSSF